MLRKDGEDRRKVNLPVGKERRSGRHDRRACPECHSALQQFVRRMERGALTRTYCVRCGWSVESRQEDRSGASAPALQKPAESLQALAERRLRAARDRMGDGAKPGRREDRRRVNVAVPVERRGGAEQRRCPDCGERLEQTVRAVPGGAITRSHCTRCRYAVESRQVDQERLRALLGFEASVLGPPEHPWLELTPDFLKLTGLRPGDTVCLEPLYTPGSAEAFTWVLKTPRSR